MPVYNAEDASGWARRMVNAQHPIHVFHEVILSIPRYATAFTYYYLDEEITSRFDDSPPEMLSAKTRSPPLGQRDCDVHIRRGCKPSPDGPKTVTLIVEIKTSNDPMTASQLLVYTVATWDQHGQGSAERKRKLPLIIGVMLNGGKEPWTEAVSAHEVIDGNETMVVYKWCAWNALVDHGDKQPDEVTCPDLNLSACFYAVCFAHRQCGSFEECLEKSFEMLEDRSDIEMYVR